MENFEVVTQSTVNVIITSNISSFSVEKRYNKNLTIGELKVRYISGLERFSIIRVISVINYHLQGKLELVTGANAGSMVLEVYNREKEFVCALTNDNSLLGSFPVDDGMRIHVLNF